MQYNEYYLPELLCGIILCMLILFIGLFLLLRQRIKVVKSENEDAEHRVIELLKKNKKLMAEVREKTSDLAGKSNELEEAYEKIHRLDHLLGIDTLLRTNSKELTKAKVQAREVNFSEFCIMFPDKDSCFKYLEELKWSNGYKCKKCGNIKWCKGKDDCFKRCTKCRYDESPTAFTIFHKLKFPITKAFYMLFLVYANKEEITPLELSQMLTLRQSTCWNFNNKINEALKNNKSVQQGDDFWGQLLLDPDAADL